LGCTTELFLHPNISELVVAVQQAKTAGGGATGEMARDIDALSDEEVERLLAAEEAARPDRR